MVDDMDAAGAEIGGRGWRMEGEDEAKEKLEPKLVWMLGVGGVGEERREPLKGRKGCILYYSIE